MTLEIVYVLSNPAMPGLVKIGRTANEEAAARLAQLYTTGVPLPFTLEFTCRVPNGAEVEAALHQAFGPHRVNPKREFFSIDASQAIGILKLLHVQDVTSQIQSEATSIEPQELAAAAEYQARRPNLNFGEMGIPEGSVLHSTHGPQTAIVASARKVMFEGEEMSLTAATRIVLGIQHSVAPGPHWQYEEQLLQDIYERTYARGNSE
jgi:hypothetical protein